MPNPSQYELQRAAFDRLPIITDADLYYHVHDWLQNYFARVNRPDDGSDVFEYLGQKIWNREMHLSLPGKPQMDPFILEVNYHGLNGQILVSPCRLDMGWDDKKDKRICILYFFATVIDNQVHKLVTGKVEPRAEFKPELNKVYVENITSPATIDDVVAELKRIHMVEEADQVKELRYKMTFASDKERSEIFTKIISMIEEICDRIQVSNGASAIILKSYIEQLRESWEKVIH